MAFSRISAALAALLLTAGPVSAEQGVIDYRQAVYKSIGGHMSGIAGIIKREVPHRDHLAVHVRGIAELAPLTLDLFPPGSGEGRTKARAEIWTDPETFAARRKDFIEAATALGAADLEGDLRAFAGMLRKLGRTCKACHDDFKID